MIDYHSFSVLRLNQIFSSEFLDSYLYFSRVRPGGSFDTEYLGGSWHEELIDGVQFYYANLRDIPLGVIQLWASACVMAGPAQDRAETISEKLVPSWTDNGNKVLEHLQLPVRMGSDEAAVAALAAGKVRRSAFPEPWYDVYPGIASGSMSSLTFAIRSPDTYHVNATIHETTGLLMFEIRQPETIRSNARDDSYAVSFASLYDEGC